MYYLGYKTVISGADAVLIAKKAKAKSDLRILAEGRELPDKGACGHYKKSYRWFRLVGWLCASDSLELCV